MSVCPLHHLHSEEKTGVGNNEGLEPFVIVAFENGEFKNVKEDDYHSRGGLWVVLQPLIAISTPLH